MIDPARRFWEWFVLENSKFVHVNQQSDDKKKELLLSLILSELHKYCNKLFFEIGGFPDQTQDLIISADGNRDYFQKAYSLVAKAPTISGWNFIALKPPIGSAFITRYQGVEMSPERSWFLPLEKNDNSAELGIELHVENFDSSRKEIYLAAGYQMLDALLGEYSAAINIAYFDVKPLQDNPAELGLIEFAELPKYIAWRKSKL